MLTQPLLIAVKENGDCWKYIGTEEGIGRSYVYSTKIKGKVRQVVIPPGFLLDGASSPRLSWTLTGFLPRGIHDPAALLHDYLYANKGRVRDFSGRMQTLSKWECDLIFYRAMRECGVKNWHCVIALIAVSVGGWYPWLKKSK